MLNIMNKDIINISNPDGTSFDKVFASVQKNKLFLSAEKIILLDNAIITRICSNNIIEQYKVINNNYFEGIGMISANYQADIQKII